jgi:hypothetical protein
MQAFVNVGSAIIIDDIKSSKEKRNIFISLVVSQFQNICLLTEFASLVLK